MPSVPKVAAFRQPPLTIPVELTREDVTNASLLAIGQDVRTIEKTIVLGGFGMLSLLIAVSAFSIWFTDTRTTSVEWADGLPILALVIASGLASWIVAKMLMGQSRRLNRHLLTQRGVPERSTVRHEIGEDGIATSTPGRTLHQPWSSFGRTIETEKLLILASHTAREPVILRQDALTPETKAVLTRWMEEKAGRPDRFPRAAPEMADARTERVEYLLTPDDHTEEVLHNLVSVYTPFAWFRSSVLPWLVLCLVFQLGPILIWVVDLRREPFDAFLASYSQTLPVGGWIWVAVTFGIALVLQLARRSMLRSNARAMQETIYGTALVHEPVVLTFSKDELRIVQGAYRDLVAREAVVRIKEAPNHLVAILSTGAHYAVPKRAFAPGQEAAFRGFAGSQVSGGAPASR